VTTVEIESILASEELTVLLDTSESSGQLKQVELVEVLEPLELDPLETEAVYQELDRRGIELLVEPEREPEPEQPTHSSSSCARPAATSCSRPRRRSSSRSASSGAIQPRSSE
jgi:hypothetical protein